MILETLSRVVWSPSAAQAKSPRILSLRRWLLFGGGAVCAFIAAELALTPFTTALDNVWAPISADRLDGEVREVRRFTETIAASHFSLSRSRLTGNPPLADGRTLVILGDSYVEALEVSDRATMGSVLERSLREAGIYANVRQYGWFGADVPRYVHVAPELIQTWDPAWVVVLITASDLGPRLLIGREKLVPHPDGHWSATNDPAPMRSGRAHRIGEVVMRQSVLLYHLTKRAQTAGLPIIRPSNGRSEGLPSTREGDLPLPERAVVGLTALQDVYGNRLRILFVADVGLDGLKPPSPAEEVTMAACAQLNVRCANTRDRMTRDRRDSLRLSRGFMNSEPGHGHLNTVGHLIAAETILQDLIAP